MPKKQPSEPEEPKPNREQRRRQKFGSGRADAESTWPTSQPNPAFSEGSPEAGDAAAAHPAAPADVDSEPSGPGTGGATEHDGRVARHEGTHATNSAKD
jgi:hypothetical protein